MAHGKGDGAFLVRTKDPLNDLFVLSVIHGDRIGHHVLQVGLTGAHMSDWRGFRGLSSFPHHTPQMHHPHLLAYSLRYSVDYAQNAHVSTHLLHHVLGAHAFPSSTGNPTLLLTSSHNPPLPRKVPCMHAVH